MSKTTTRYSRSVEPVYTDGRDINPELAQLSGEAGSQVSIGSTDVHIGSVAKAWNALPEPEREDPTYYDVPMLKEPVWGWAIPLYYYIGGLTGGSLVLGAAAQIRRSKESRALIQRCHAIGFAGAVVSGGLLVYASTDIPFLLLEPEFRVSWRQEFDAGFFIEPGVGLGGAIGQLHLHLVCLGQDRHVIDAGHALRQVQARRAGRNAVMVGKVVAPS